MVSIAMGYFFVHGHVIMDVGARMRQEASLQLVFQVHVILRGQSKASSETDREDEDHVNFVCLDETDRKLTHA